MSIERSESCFAREQTQSLSNNVVLDQEEVRTKAEALRQRAIEANPPIESRLKYLAELHSGCMRGLEFKVKPLASLIRKMCAIWQPGMSVSQLCDLQYDVLRYTMEMPADKYGMGVKIVLQKMQQSENCEVVDVKNYWGCLTYRGINTIMQTPEGVRFELQFHTPESFEQKQTKTHILYEALRREQDPVKQNVFFLDMMSMWDTIGVPAGVEDIGVQKSQTLPERKSVSEAEQKMIERVWALKKMLHEDISVAREALQRADKFIIKCVEYAAGLFNSEMAGLEIKFKSLLKARRKVETELRKKMHVQLSSDLHEIQLPDIIDGMSMSDYIRTLCRRQADLLTYKVIVPNSDVYTESVEGMMDVMRRNGFVIANAENYWQDQEKHHAIAITFEVTDQHFIKIPCYFKIEFHTRESYDCSIERHQALTYIEESMYAKGEAYNKIAADMQVRFDATMIRHWARVVTPAGALRIGVPRNSLPTAVDLESEGWVSYSTMHENKYMRRNRIIGGCIFAAGVATGFVLGGTRSALR